MVWLGNLNFPFRVKSICSVWKQFVRVRQRHLCQCHIRWRITYAYFSLKLLHRFYVHTCLFLYFSAFIHYIVTVKKCVPWCCIYSRLSNYISLFCHPREREREKIKLRMECSVPWENKTHSILFNSVKLILVCSVVFCSGIKHKKFFWVISYDS